MANYLPVLLVSVSANTVPDDSSVSTLPRGQVDYLSHNWEEEDVWRSWRNMTRQKNEIANGLRLENASWRTWWKQRNGLGTVTPETLNWLKDSDVTWLYGPLHTAVDWAPPKPSQLTGNSALDLSSPTHKPILKHRSISQLLTSDLPNSPVFSPAESEDEVDYPAPAIPLQLPEEPGGDRSSQSRRPPLIHTKSDTYITRPGPHRPFRKGSPPQLPPPTSSTSRTSLYSPTNLEGYSNNANQSSDGSSASTCHGNGNGNGTSINNGQKKRHISFNTFVEQYIAIEKPKKGQGGLEEEEDGDDVGDNVDGRVGNRYLYEKNPWGDDDGYEEDEEDSEDDAEAISLSVWDARYSGSGSALSGSDSDSYDGGVGEEDGANGEEDGDDMIELHPSFSARPQNTSARSQSRSSSSSTSTSTSISTSRSPPDADAMKERPTPKRRFSASTTSTYRPRIHRNISSTSGSSRRDRHDATPRIDTTSSERSEASTTSPPPQQTRVTIAPIAPTILKTGPHSELYSHEAGWSEGFGDEGGSDDGIWGGGTPRWWGAGAGATGKGKAKEESDEEDGQTPVELVYMPPFGSNYNLRTARTREQRTFMRDRERESTRAQEKEIKPNGGMGAMGVESQNGPVSEVMEDHEDGFGNGDRDVYHRAAFFSVGDEDADTDADDMDSTLVPAGGVHMGTPVPTVVVGSDAREDSIPRRSSSSSLSRNAPIEPGRGRSASASVSSSGVRSGLEDRERSKSQSRSRSRSRTPSPAIISPSTSLISSAPSAPSSSVTTAVPVPLRRGSGSMSSSPNSVSASNGALLSPPPRGRGSYQDFGQMREQQTARGRSSTRTASSSLSDRERSAGHNGSIGSLSPDGIGLGDVAGAYTGGRIDREWEREREREKEREKRAADVGRDREREKTRGRDRVETKRLRQSQSVSPDDVQDSLLRVSPASTARVEMPPASAVDHALRYDDVTQGSTSASSSSSSCSTSSANTIVPSRSAPLAREVKPTTVPIDVRIAEEYQRSLQPTPSNSPSVFKPRAAIPASPFAPPPSPPHPTKTKPPLFVPPPHPAEPSTSYSISPPREANPTPSSPTRNSDTTIVGKAVGIVSSAGAFLGLWHHSNST